MSCGGGGTAPAKAPPVQTPITVDEVRILVIGQSILSNCNEFSYGPVANVFQIGRDGATKEARDPFEWADCAKGSMWMPLGQKIIEGAVAKKVVFMPIGVASTKVQDRQQGGSAFGKLNDAIALIKENGLAFDLGLWHQGSADFGMSKQEYQTRLLSVIDYVNKNLTIKRWLIGIHSRCGATYDREVEAAQVAVGNAASAGRYPGANTNLLGNEYRFDKCHLNKLGQEEMATMWVEAIKSANARQ